MGELADLTSKIDTYLTEKKMTPAEHAMVEAQLLQVAAINRQTAVLERQDAEAKRSEALLVGMRVLKQNDNAHQAAMEHLFKMVGGLLNAAQAIPGYTKAPESARAAFDAAETFCKQGGKNFGPLFGRVLTIAAYDALSTEEKAQVDAQLEELVKFLQARTGG